MPPGLSTASLPCPVALCCSFLQACSRVHLLSPQRRTVLRRLCSPVPASFLYLPKASASSRWNLNTCSKDQAWALTVTETPTHTAASFSSCSWPALRPGRSLGWINLSDRQKAQARPGQADGTTRGDILYIKFIPSGSELSMKKQHSPDINQQICHDRLVRMSLCWLFGRSRVVNILLQEVTLNHACIVGQTCGPFLDCLFRIDSVSHSTAGLVVAAKMHM